MDGRGWRRRRSQRENASAPGTKGCGEGTSPRSWGNSRPKAGALGAEPLGSMRSRLRPRACPGVGR